ncbi:MAG: hypothetical protein ACKO32_02020 [Planctomycetia bacterium]
MHSDSRLRERAAANLARSAKVARSDPLDPADARRDGFPANESSCGHRRVWVHLESEYAMHPSPISLSVRIDPSNLDHHLWNNHGIWWCHYTLHRGERKRRVRLSLGVREVEAARRRRDQLFEHLGL